MTRAHKSVRCYIKAQHLQNPSHHHKRAKQEAWDAQKLQVQKLKAVKWQWAGYSSRACICKSERSEGITSTASSSYSIAVLRNKLFLFLPFSLPSLFIIFINVMIQCLASPTLSLSAFTGAMSREGHCGHHENSIVLITAMIDRLCYKMSGERGWDIGKAELRNREKTVHRRMEVWHMNAEQMRWSKTKEKGEVTEGKIK